MKTLVNDMGFKLKSWMIYLICLGAFFPLGLVIGDVELVGSFMVFFAIWGGIGFLIQNVAHRQFKRKIISIPLGVISAYTLGALWYFFVV